MTLVAINGIRLNVETRAESPRHGSGSGEPLLLLHGFTGAVSTWRDLASTWAGWRHSLTGQEWDKALATLQRNRDGTLPGLCAVTMFIFGAGWLASARLNSAVISTGLALAAPALLVIAFEIVDSFFQRSSVAWVERAGPLTTAVLGLAGFIAGCVYYLRRVEP